MKSSDALVKLAVKAMERSRDEMFEQMANPPPYIPPPVLREATVEAIGEQVAAITVMAIAAGHPEPAALAKAALKTREIEFERWYA